LEKQSPGSSGLFVLVGKAFPDSVLEELKEFKDMRRAELRYYKQQRK